MKLLNHLKIQIAQENALYRNTAIFMKKKRWKISNSFFKRNNPNSKRENKEKAILNSPKNKYKTLNKISAAQQIQGSLLLLVWSYANYFTSFKFFHLIITEIITVHKAWYYKDQLAKFLKQWLAYDKCSINVWWTNEMSLRIAIC